MDRETVGRRSSHGGNSFIEKKITIRRCDRVADYDVARLGVTQICLECPCASRIDLLLHPAIRRYMNVGELRIARHWKI